MKAYLFPTFACNLSCPLCYQRHLPRRPGYMMTAHQFEKIVSAVGKANLGEREWVITGGEPTVWPILREATERLHQLRPQAQVRVVSNGFGRTLKDYGAADVIQITDYGAINRLDYYRLKKQGKSRVRIQNAVHWDWDMKAESALPGHCGCTGLSFVGEKVWCCAMAAAAETPDCIDLDEDLKLFSRFTEPHYQELCKSCLVNRKNRQAPKPVLQISLWEGRNVILG